MAFWRKKKEIAVNNDSHFKDDGVFCAMPWVHLHVTQNGNVTPCCQAPWGDEAKFGNINTSTIQEVFYYTSRLFLVLMVLCYTNKNKGDPH